MRPRYILRSLSSWVESSFITLVVIAIILVLVAFYYGL